jgi:putative DNA primase/helicase
LGQTVEESVTREDMAAAVKFLNYFKNHARRVYTGLYGASASDKLAADVGTFVVNQGGSWEGSASELFDALESEYKPERPEDLSKLVRAIVKRSPLLQFEDRGRKDNLRIFRMFLRNAGLAGAGAER